MVDACPCPVLVRNASNRFQERVVIPCPYLQAIPVPIPNSKHCRHKQPAPGKSPEPSINSNACSGRCRKKKLLGQIFVQRLQSCAATRKPWQQGSREFQGRTARPELIWWSGIIRRSIREITWIARISPYPYGSSEASWSTNQPLMCLFVS